MTHRPSFVSSAALALCLAFASSVRADDVAPAAPPVEGVHFEPGTPAFADVLAKAKEAGKPVFIDFTTEWCGWCRKLEKDTYSQASVGEVMKGFVNVMIDSEKGEGVEISKRYGVNSWPTLVIVDATGEEIDRISGYRQPEPFIKEVTRIQKGEGTLAALKKAYADKPDDLSAGVDYAAKLAAAKPADSASLFTELAAKADAAKDRPAQAKVMLEQASGKLATARTKETVGEVATAAETLVKDFADTPAAAQAASRLGRAVVFAGEKRAMAFVDAARAIATDAKDKLAVESLAVVLHRQALAATLKRQGDAAVATDDAQAMNEAAWNCFELKVNVKAALGWAKAAVEKSNRDPMILDTLANLLWLSGKHDEALKIETEALGAVADPAMKKEFAANVAKWKAELKVKGDEADEDGEEDDGDEEGEKPEPAKPADK